MVPSYVCWVGFVGDVTQVKSFQCSNCRKVMTIGLVVYDGFKSLHCGADSTSAIGTKTRRLALDSGRTGAEQGVRQRKGPVGCSHKPVWGRPVKGRVVSWCLSADVGQEDAFADSVK